MKTITLQYTLFCITNKYKPVSCLIEVEVDKYNTDPLYYKTLAIQKICNKRYWTKHDLLKYGYTKIKCRRYEKVLDKGADK